MEYRTREQWGAEFDVSTVPRIALPVRRRFVHHTAGSWTDDPNDDMLTVERIDVNRFGKPSYDWGVHPSGVVLEGMTDHLSPDTFGHNRDSLSIMFFGNFEFEHPTDAAMLAARELALSIIHFGMATPDATIEGHRDVYPTACPGRNLYLRIGELLVPFPPPPPAPAPVKTEEDMLIYQTPNQGDVMLHNGKLTACYVAYPLSITRVDLRTPAGGAAEWESIKRAYGPVLS